MATYTGPKVRLSRQLGVAISDNQKHLNSRRLDTPPGGTSKRMRRLSDYGVRLREKQKLRYYYNVQEKQLRRYVKEATRRKGNTGENLLEILERRLDSVVRRMNFGRSIWQARQVVNHGHVLVNGRKVDIPSYQVRPGDVITVREKSKEVIERTVELMGGESTYEWMALDRSSLTITITDKPKGAQHPFDLHLGMIVEFYSN
ncbi:MAG: 30S ribosomal protein S4 [Planctomycetota bacterium]|nr:30S ribosomal protein S4 [Planctomycetota bacterium]MDA1114667.1 30S ribosomal protein S4 [Planctomycetota bacterium]